MTDKESEPCVFLCELHRSPASVVLFSPLSLSFPFQRLFCPERDACAHTHPDDSTKVGKADRSEKNC